MNLNFVNVCYGQNAKQVRWQGVKLSDEPEMDRFMQDLVASRLYDTPAKEEYENCLKNLDLTNMGREALADVLQSGSKESRDWAVGEALAEALLIKLYEVIFPWNMERDKRNSEASLPGADIVGFVQLEGVFRLVLGEVKTSSEAKFPPQVMSGRSGGLEHQIDELSTNLGKVNTLLRWLYTRCKRTGYMEMFEDSARAYLNSGNKDIVLFGMLIRDTDVNEADLKLRGKSLGRKLLTPTTCELMAVYLPFEISSLSKKINGEPL